MLMQIDGTFLFVVISFLIFLFIIKTILFEPMTKVIDERQKFFAKNAKMETESKEKAKALIDEKNKAIIETRSKASDALKEISENTTKENEARIERAKKNAISKVKENQENLDNEKTETKREAKVEIEGIVKAMMSKILGDEVEVSLEDEKINQYLNI